MSTTNRSRGILLSVTFTQALVLDADQLLDEVVELLLLDHAVACVGSIGESDEGASMAWEGPLPHQHAVAAPYTDAGPNR